MYTFEGCGENSRVKCILGHGECDQINTIECFNIKYVVVLDVVFLSIITIFCIYLIRVNGKS